MNDIYLCLKKMNSSRTFYVDFTDDKQFAANEIKRGGRVFKLEALEELKDIEISYMEIPYE